MCCWVFSGNPRFATTLTHFPGHAKKLIHFLSSVSSCSGYRLHSAWRRGRHLRLRRKEHRGWRSSVTGGETQKLLQTNFPPARYYFQTRGGSLNSSNYPYQLDYHVRRSSIRFPWPDQYISKRLQVRSDCDKGQSKTQTKNERRGEQLESTLVDSLTSGLIFPQRSVQTETDVAHRTPPTTTR